MLARTMLEPWGWVVQRDVDSGMVHLGCHFRFYSCQPTRVPVPSLSHDLCLAPFRALGSLSLAHVHAHVRVRVPCPVHAVHAPVLYLCHVPYLDLFPAPDPVLSPYPFLFLSPCHGPDPAHGGRFHTLESVLALDLVRSS